MIPKGLALRSNVLVTYPFIITSLFFLVSSEACLAKENRTMYSGTRRVEELLTLGYPRIPGDGDITLLNNYSVFLSFLRSLHTQREQYHVHTWRGDELFYTRLSTKPWGWNLQLEYQCPAWVLHKALFLEILGVVQPELCGSV